MTGLACQCSASISDSRRAAPLFWRGATTLSAVHGVILTEDSTLSYVRTTGGTGRFGKAPKRERGGGGALFLPGPNASWNAVVEP